MQILKIGDRGAEVALLQTSLHRAGWDLARDGIFGSATRRAVTEFQRRHALTPDGIFGPRTEAALSPWLRGYAIHTVRPGDTLWRIADRYDSTLLALETANPRLDPFDLRPGQQLVVPFLFPVVPTDIPWSTAATEYVLDGLQRRYPVMGREAIGHSAGTMPLHALAFGDGPRRVLFTGAHHANEWITAPVLLKFAEDQLSARTAGEEGAEELFFRCRVVMVPVVNPDGVDLVTGAYPPGERLEAAEAIAASWPAIPWPSGWKANLAGTDLNLQYPAKWEEARRIKFAQGYTRPAPRDYVGTAPLSAPESAALAAFTRKVDPALVLAYHTQGRVIYWRFGALEPPGSAALAERMAAVSGYALGDAPYDSSFAGYKDWFIQEFGRPGFTIEAGEGENPLPIRQFDRIYADNSPLLRLAALGE